MYEFPGLTPKTCSYIKGNDKEEKKAKGTKKCIIKRKYKFKDYKNCMNASKIEHEINVKWKKKIL